MMESFPFPDIVKDVSGGNLKVKKSDYLDDGSIPVIDQSKNDIGGYTNDTSYQFSAAPLPIVVFGDHTCCVKHMDQPFAMGADGVKVLKPAATCDAKYLFHFLNQVRITDGGYDRHFKYLKRIEIPLPMKNGKPDLDEQRRIAGILDQADAIRRKRRQALQLTDDFLRSTFLDLFGDPVNNPKGWDDKLKLIDVADIASGITKGRKLNGQATREVPYLAVVNVQERHLNLETVKTIEATDKEIERYKLLKDDLLLTEGGDPDKLGRGTLWNNELPESIHQNHIFRVRLHDKDFDPCYLNWLVGSARGKVYFLRSAKQTTGIASINMTQLKDFPLLRPPIKLQQEFARISRTADQKKEKLLTLSNITDDLFASLQQRAFKGEL